MKDQDQDLLGNLQEELTENFCEPFQGVQKQECANYYEKWIGEEEEQEQADEQKHENIS